MARVYLVRHGLHDWVGKGLAGRMPGVHLSAEGRAQAMALAGHFATFDVSRVIASPLERCQETAAPIADRLGCGVVTDVRVTELDCGVWTGENFERLANDPRWQSWNSERGRNGMPGGETIQQVQVRAMAAMADLAAGDAGPAVVVNHADVIKVVVLSLLGGDLDRHDRLDVEPASITTLDLWPGGGKVVRLNEVPAA